MVLLLHISSVQTTSFNYRFFDSPENLTFQGTYFLKDGAVLLNSNENGSPVLNTVGRMLYPEPVRLWDRRTGTVADFTTTFSFMIKTLTPPNGGDGIVFFIAPNGSTIPPNSSGGSLGIVYENNNNGTQKPLVAVELDTYPNVNDPLSDHLGIDVNSIISVATWNTTLKFSNNTRGNAWIGYNSSTKILGVSVSFDQNPVFDGKYLLTHAVNIKNVLPELVNVGLSASAGNSYELHNIYSWEFDSTELPLNSSTRGTQVPRGSGTGGTQAPQGSNSGGSQVPQVSGAANKGKKKNMKGLLIGLGVGGTVLAVGLGLIFFLLWKKRKGKQEEEEEDMFDATGDPYYVRGAGPRRFTYKELDRATSHFAKDGKLGKGGFGEVYKGFVNDSNLNVAVKRVSRGSKQGKKEFVSEIGLVAWMTELYENGTHLEAVDTRLNTDFDEQQLERLVVVGLWCSNHDHNLRPSIRQAISVLNFDSPLPDLSSRMLVPTDLISLNHSYETSNATYDSSILLPRS
ncbi:hypothetical protein Scep_001402 [Stephania cephalantha]|uniref:Protein kinase domain-containing protein n=1 Tax=Stephania cephalantha TaxID=152367 RepID=A0AAP0Q7P5_9MAGN